MGFRVIFNPEKPGMEILRPQSTPGPSSPGQIEFSLIPDLLHLKPSYHLQFKSGLPSCEPISATIVFPCLVLRSKQWHEDMRRETSNLRLQINDEICEKFIHHERTLNETHYPSLSADVLARRNGDQVVFRLRGDVARNPFLTNKGFSNKISRVSVHADTDKR
ncbi:hypothetical protein F4801DRAFT_143789 [Xylaria longipes]|nr:hypothetical protein F4801DRAFT_143789 [Xylaria longipes]